MLAWFGYVGVDCVVAGYLINLVRNETDQSVGEEVAFRTTPFMSFFPRAYMQEMFVSASTFGIGLVKLLASRALTVPRKSIPRIGFFGRYSIFVDNFGSIHEERETPLYDVSSTGLDAGSVTLSWHDRQYATK